MTVSQAALKEWSFWSAIARTSFSGPIWPPARSVCIHVASGASDGAAPSSFQIGTTPKFGPSGARKLFGSVRIIKFFYTSFGVLGNRASRLGETMSWSSLLTGCCILGFWEFVETRWGPHAVDLLVSSRNTHGGSFLEIGCSGTLGMHVCCQYWNQEITWINPPLV